MWPRPRGRMAFLKPNSCDSLRWWTVRPKSFVYRSMAASMSRTTTDSSMTSPSMASPPSSRGASASVSQGLGTRPITGEHIIHAEEVRMQVTRWALSVPLDAFTLAEHADIAREAERLGYTGAWSFEVDGIDGFTPLAVVGMATGLRVGIAIANVFTRGPATLAISAAGMAEIAPGRFCLGVGAGSEPIVETWNGGRFDRPARRVREMVQFLRSALAGERVVFRGETFSVDGFRLSRPLERPVPIHVAALRSGMLGLAGEVADGVILNWLSADDVPRSVAVAREAAARAGRDPKAIEITARLLVNLDEPGPAADLGVRRHIAAYLNVPVYRAFHEWLGRGGELAPMWE